MNALDIALALLIALAVGLAVHAVVRMQKKGGCCGDCARCGHACGGGKRA